MPEIANMTIDQIMVHLFRNYSARKVLKTAGSYLTVNTYDKHREQCSSSESENDDTPVQSPTVDEIFVEKLHVSTNTTEVNTPDTATVDAESNMDSDNEHEHKHKHDIDVTCIGDTDDDFDANNDNNNDNDNNNYNDDDDDDDESKEIKINVNLNIGKKKSSKQVDTTRKFKTKKLKSKNVDGYCNGYLASGKPCKKTKCVRLKLCKRCIGELKERGATKFDEELELFYRDVKFTVDDPNELFQKGQIIRQYSQGGRTFEFNGLKTQDHYYIYTKKDAENNFKHCSIITTANPFVKGVSIAQFDLAEHEIIEKQTFNINENEQVNEDLGEEDTDEELDGEEEDKNGDLDGEIIDEDDDVLGDEIMDGEIIDEDRVVLDGEEDVDEYDE